MSLHDHHFHPLGYVGMTKGLNLWDANDLSDLLRRTSDYAATRSGPVIGNRVSDERLAERRMPTRHDIDDVVADRPVLLYRYCGHIAVANTAALTMGGVDYDTPDPPGGSIDRSPGGLPTGVLRETGVKLVSRVIEESSTPPADDEVLECLSLLPSLGLDSITAMVAVNDAIWCGVGDELGTLHRLAEDLPIDIGVHVITEDPDVLRQSWNLLNGGETRLRFRGWKGFADGSLGGHTAALSEPYSDRPDTKGQLRIDPAQATKMATAALQLGGDVAIHAIGDIAVAQVLDIFAHLVSEGADPRRLRVEHASILTEELIERFAQLGVTASVQPAFLASEEDWLHKRLDDSRMNMAYRFRDLIEAGIPVIGGSDCPVEPPDPEIGIRAAELRYGINPGQAITRKQAEALFAPPEE